MDGLPVDMVEEDVGQLPPSLSVPNLFGLINLGSQSCAAWYNAFVMA